MKTPDKCSQSLPAVSYTHLDVYKRQALPATAGSATEAAVTEVQNASVPMAEAGRSMMQSAADGATEAASMLETAAGSAVDSAAAKAQEKTAQFSTIGSQMVQGMARCV